MEAKYNMFEECVASIFDEADYSVDRNIVISNHREIDIIAEKNDVKYCVEVKYRTVNSGVFHNILAIASEKGMTPVVVVAIPISDEKRQYYNEEFPEVLILDIANLLYAVKEDENLRNDLIACLDYSVDSIIPKKGFIEVNSLKHSDNTDSYIKEMESCIAGREMYDNYQTLCHKLLKNIFSEDLALWKEQYSSNNNLYRFDLLCRIKDNNQKTFWNIIEKYFNSKYIVFEFKNYEDKITQKEIYTTERYLYAKALRSVAIIISQNGYDDNATWAAKGCLRENGKLIILITTKELIEMNRMKENQEDPSDFLLNKLDDILLKLEK